MQFLKRVWDDDLSTYLLFVIILGLILLVFFAFVMRPLVVAGAPSAVGILAVWVALPAALVVSGIGALLRQNWARWPCLACCAALALWQIVRILSDGFGWRPIIYGYMYGQTMYLLWTSWEKPPFWRRSSTTSNDNRPLISIVLLRRSVAYLDDHILESLAERAWTPDFVANEDDCFVVGASPMSILRFREHMFLVHNHDQPYVDDPEAAAAEITELRLRKAFTEHRAWMAVDLLGDPDAADDLKPVYHRIGQLIAALADDDSLAVYCPQTNRGYPYHPDMDEKLRGPEPLTDLMHFVPVYNMESTDERLVAAVAEAQARWSEFVTAFENRQPDQLFGVKAPFHDGDECEFMWFTAQAIEGDQVLGILDNDPVHVKNVRYGGKVCVPVADVCDWTYPSPSGDGIVGAFSVKVIMDAQRAAQDKPLDK